MMRSVWFKAQGMKCGHGIHSIEGAVNKPGASAKADLQSDTVAVDYDENRVMLESIKEAIED